MINIRTIRKIENNGGLTLKNGKIINYKTGWQVGLYGVTCTSPEEVRAIIKKFNGNCGIWLEDGIYYIDYSIRIDTKSAALIVGRNHNQISIFGWAKKNLAYC